MHRSRVLPMFGAAALIAVVLLVGLRCRQQPSQARGACARHAPTIEAMVRNSYPGSAAYQFPRVLPAGVVAAEAVGASSWTHQVADSTCLYWIDRQPSQSYPHPTAAVLIDLHTGSLIDVQDLEWDVAVDGKPWLSTSLERAGSPDRLVGNAPAGAATSGSGVLGGAAQGVTGTIEPGRKEAIVIMGENPDKEPALKAHLERAVAHWGADYHVHWRTNPGPGTFRSYVRTTLQAIAQEHQQLDPPGEPEVLLFVFMGHAGGREGTGIYSKPANEFYAHTALANDLHAQFETSIYVTILDACYQGGAAQTFPASAATFDPERQGVVMTATGNWSADQTTRLTETTGSGLFTSGLVGGLQGDPAMGWEDALDQGKQELRRNGVRSTPMIKKYPDKD